MITPEPTIELSPSRNGNGSHETHAEIVAATIQERGKVYGDPLLSHENIGLSWTGLIQQHYGIKLDHPLPDYLVAQMMVVFKMQRATRVYHADNFIDAAAYLNFSERGQRAAHEARI